MTTIFDRTFAKTQPASPLTDVFDELAAIKSMIIELHTKFDNMPQKPARKTAEKEKLKRGHITAAVVDYMRTRPKETLNVYQIAQAVGGGLTQMQVNQALAGSMASHGIRRITRGLYIYEPLS